jgi:hypothetical protein
MGRVFLRPNPRKSLNQSPAVKQSPDYPLDAEDSAPKIKISENLVDIGKLEPIVDMA